MSFSRSRSMPLLELVKIFAIKLTDYCIHANFVAVEQFAHLQSSLQPESIICATIITLELAHL